MPMALYDAVSSTFGPSGTDHSVGLVPDPGATPGTTRFLREDGTWVTINISYPNTGILNGYLSYSVASNNLTIALKTIANDGDPSPTDPVYVIFRDDTLNDGKLTVLEITSAQSIVIPDTATLGASNNVAFKIWVVAFNDGGTFRLGVINTVSGTNIYPLGRNQIVSATQIGTGSDSAQTFYSSGANVTSQPYTILGYCTYETGLATAGTYNTAPTVIIPFGLNIKLPGDTIQTVINISGATVEGTTILPADNTIPLITEGVAVLTTIITAISAANLFVANAQIVVKCSTGAAFLASSALFIGGVTNSFAAVLTRGAVNQEYSIHNLNYLILCSSTSACTFNIRTGAGAAGTTTINNIFGGVANTFLNIQELQT